MKPASGYAFGPKASTQVAIAAVSSAMARGGITQAGQIFLFLSTHFHQHIDECLRAVVAISGSMNVVGASAAGVFTEQDWSLDSPAAAALVLPLDYPTQQRNSHLALAAPNAINQFWLNDGTLKFGGIAGDATGQGQYALWQAAQQRFSYIQIPLEARSTVISEGSMPLGGEYTITASQGLCLETLDHQAALSTLGPHLARYPQEVLLAKIWLDNTQTTPSWIPVIGTDLAKGTVMLAHELPIGAKLCWGHFNAYAASQELAQQIMLNLAGKPQPKWALAFSSHRRAMAADGLSEPDWTTLRTTLPDVPFAGFYGNGQIIPAPKAHPQIDKLNRIVDNSVLLALFD
jgi:small ligand-binding sensory domain FIST